MVAGTPRPMSEGGIYADDLSYVADLGLIAPDPPLRPANPIYREVILRTLADDDRPEVESPPQQGGPAR